MSKQKLLAQLQSDDCEQQLEAAYQLQQKGEPAETYLPAMLAIVRATDPGEQEQDWPFMLRMVFHAVETQAVRAVADQALDDTLPLAERVNLVRYLPQFYDKASVAEPQLAKLIASDADPRLKTWAEVVLCRRVMRQSDVSDRIIAAAGDPADPALRIQAFNTLHRCQASAAQQEAIRRVSLAALSDDNGLVCRQAAMNLSADSLTPAEWRQVYAALDGPHGLATLPLISKQEKPPKQILSKVMPGLAVDPEEEAFQSATRILAKIGRPALDPLLELATNRRADENARGGALWALCRMSPKLVTREARTTLYQLMKKKPREIQIQAAAALANLGEPAAKVLPTVVDGLVDEEWNLHTRLARAVLKKRPEGEIVPYMIARYGKIEEETEAAKLMHFFLQVATRSEEAARFLVEQLRTADGFLDSNMIHNALQSMEYPTVPLLVDALNDAAAAGDHETTRRVLAGMIWLIGSDPDVGAFIEPATRLLESNEPAVAFAAARLLVQFPSAPSQACQIYMTSEVPGARFARYVAELKETPARSLKDLFELRSMYDMVRQDEIRNRLNELAQQTLPRLLSPRNQDETYETIEALEATRLASPPVIKFLVAMLDKPALFDKAVRALSNLGDAAAPAVDKLRGMLKQPNRLEAIKALGDLQQTAQPAAPDLVALLDTDEATQIVAVVDALGKIGPQSAPTARKILKLTSHENQEIRREAISALRTCQTPAAAKRLLELARDEEHRQGALYSLTAYPPYPEEAFAILEQELADDFPYFATQAVKALGPAAARLLPTMVNALPHQNSESAYDMYDAIGALGSAAESALPALETSLRGRQHHAAARNIRRISPQRASELNLPDVYAR